MKKVSIITPEEAALKVQDGDTIATGSPQAQRIMIARQSNLEMKKELAKKIARIK